MLTGFTVSDLHTMRSTVRNLATEAWSTEYACYKALGKTIKTFLMDPRLDDERRSKYNGWMNVLTFRQLNLLHETIYMGFDDFTKDYNLVSRTNDLNVVFAQCSLMYPEFFDWFSEEARKAQVQKEMRKQNAETNKTLMNLDNEYKDIRAFVFDLRKAIDNKACINYGSAKISVYIWAPGTCRRYRTSTKIYTMDSRKTPLTAENLKAAADTILESCGEGW